MPHSSSNGSGKDLRSHHARHRGGADQPCSATATRTAASHHARNNDAVRKQLIDAVRKQLMRRRTESRAGHNYNIRTQNSKKTKTKTWQLLSPTEKKGAQLIRFLRGGPKVPYRMPQNERVGGFHSGRVPLFVLGDHPCMEGCPLPLRHWVNCMDTRLDPAYIT
jgi:hypothetical protein